MTPASPAEHDMPEQAPQVSLVLVAYNIARELPRTLYTLSAAYQRDIAAQDFEIIVVDNGSPQAVDPAIWKNWPGQFRLLRVSSPSVSPADAANQGIAAARGECIGVMIDGARMVSPGLLHQAWRACQTDAHAVVGALGWYLGHDYQRQSMLAGYGPEQEDALLACTDWQRDGYRLFGISAMDESSTDGWLAPVAEFNAIFMHRQRWAHLQGFDTRFDLPGGGLVNLDLCKRALEADGAQPIVLLGEATFHQQHGGVATNSPLDQALRDWTRWSAQYEAIRGQPYALPQAQRPLQYWGHLPEAMRLHFLRALAFPSQAAAGATPPLGADFVVQRWAMPQTVWGDAALTPPQRAMRELLAQALAQGRYRELACACRGLRQQLPHWEAPRQLLSLICAWSPHGDPEEALAAPSPLVQALQPLIDAEATGAALPLTTDLEADVNASAEVKAQQDLQTALEQAQSREALWHTSAQQYAHQLAQTQAELQAMCDSLSWRLTAGLRAAQAWLQTCWPRR